MADKPAPKKLGRYEILRELGRGAMGVVYEGRDPNIGRRVAIKTARRDVMEASGLAQEMMERFLREARAAGALNHPSVITIYDADEEDEIAYIAMEFIAGGSLADAIRAKKRLDIKRVVEIAATAAEALAAAHDAGIVHRDVKPANILLPESGPLKLADFGIARVSDSNLTQDGALVGTPHYMSPEQFMGQQIDGRSDLFSLGIILYELVTGEKPFTGEALSTVMHNCIRTNPVPPTELNFNVNNALNGVIMKALAKRPIDRYADGRAMAAALYESLKLNPDPVILGLPTLNEGATVSIAGVNIAAQTVISSAHEIPAIFREGGAQAASPPPAATPPPANETVPGSLPPGAGIPAPSPSWYGQTKSQLHSDSHLRAQAAAEAAAPPPSPTPTDAPAPAAAPPASAGLPRFAIPGAIGALVVIVAIVGATFAMRGGTPNAPANTPAAAPAATSAGNYYSSITFDLYQAVTEKGKELQGGKPSAAVIGAAFKNKDLRAVNKAKLRITTDTGEVVDIENYAGSSDSVKIPGHAKRLSYVLTLEDGTEATAELPRPPEKPDEAYPEQIVVFPKAK